MRSILISTAAGSLLAALAIAQYSQPSASQPRYTVRDLGTLGGTFSNGYGPNVVGWVAGNSNLAPGGAQHASLWYGFGQLHDLGTLGGSKCPPCNSVAYWVNAFGEAAITSETSTYNGATGEDFCGYGTHYQCLAAIWRNGFMTALPTLPGGNNASAYGLNDLGQAIGYSENGKGDGSCVVATPYQKIQFEAVIWGPNGEIQELRPLPGDTVGFANGVNNSGQVVGGSGLCSNTSEVTVASSHAVLWERDGSPVDLGHLEGTAPGLYNLATSVNDRGDVVGAALAPDGNIHAFLWTRETGMQDYGAYIDPATGKAAVTVPPLVNTINNKGEIVGLAISATGAETALIWQGKTPVALNKFIPADSGWNLQCAQGVNYAGEISGFGMLTSGPHAGEVHAFLLTPR